MTRSDTEPAAVSETLAGHSSVIPSHYTDSMQHVLAELERVDLLVQAQVRRQRQRHKVDEQFQGLVISEQEVDELLARPVGIPQFARAGSEGWTQVQSALDRLQEQ